MHSIKKFSIIACLLGWLILENVCCRKPSIFKESRTLMGTLVSVELAEVSSSTASAVLDGVWEEAERLENLFSGYIPGSEVNRVNQAAFEEPVRLSCEMMEVLNHAREISQTTKGAFDISVGPLMRLWGFFPGKNGNVPPEKEVRAVLSQVDWRAVELDPSRRTVRLLKPGMEIALAGLAKGYIVDRMAAFLVRRGVKSALLNAGGDIYCLGQRPGGGGWRIGVEHPRREGEVLTVLELKDQAVATSGDYRNYFIKGRRRYSHIIDPRTGQPALSGVVEASILAPDCVTADGLATAVFVLGAEKGLELLKNLEGVEGIIITENKGKIRVLFSQGLESLFPDSPSNYGGNGSLSP